MSSNGFKKKLKTLNVKAFLDSFELKKESTLYVLGNETLYSYTLQSSMSKEERIAYPGLTFYYGTA